MELKVILNDKSFYENFETHDILLRFLKLMVFYEVLKPIVFNRGSERLFLRFKKYLGEHVPQK